MTITYRSLARLPWREVDYEHLIFEQFTKWLHDDPPKSPRHFNSDRLEFNALTAFTPDSDVVLGQRIEKDGSRVIRGRLTENKEQDGEEQRWISTFTLYQPGRHDQQGFFMYETDSPIKTDPRSGIRRPVPAGNPRFLRRLLELDEFEFFDGQFAKMSIDPRIVDVDECDLLINIACDPDRRGAFVVMGTDLDSPFPKQYELGKKLLAGIYGVATSVIMMPEATEEFNRMIGPMHSVHPGSIRSFHPEADPASAIDARRHPFVKAEKIQEMGDKIVTRMLESATRSLSLDAPLPKLVQRIDERMNALLNDIVISGKRIVAYAPEKPLDFSPEKLAAEVEEFLQSKESDVMIARVSNYLAVQAKLREVAPFDELTLPVAEEIVDRLERFDLVTQMFHQVEAESNQHRLTIGKLHDDLAEKQVDYQEEFETAQNLAAKYEYLKSEMKLIAENEADAKEIRRKLKVLAFDDQEWLAFTESRKTFAPNSFAEIVLSFDHLPNLMFTGDTSEIGDLDGEDLGANAAKTWKGLRMLNDYVRAKKEDVAKADIMQYLLDCPAGFFTDWSSDKYAAKESDSVSKNPVLRDKRIFPVPENVVSSKKVTMFSHLKVGYSLRVHFFEDVARTGKIYVGYIGKHLPTTSSN